VYKTVFRQLPIQIGANPVYILHQEMIVLVRGDEKPVEDAKAKGRFQLDRLSRGLPLPFT
jgi:hypothetical protein